MASHEVVSNDKMLREVKRGNTVVKVVLLVTTCEEKLRDEKSRGSVTMLKTQVASSIRSAFLKIEGKIVSPRKSI